MPIKIPVVQTGLEKSISDAAKKAGRNLKINLGSNAKDIKSLEQPLGRITGQADEFTKSMEAANARVLAFGASVGIINTVVQSFKTLITTTIEVEKSLAKINSILKTNSSGLAALKDQIFSIAKGTEQTFDTVAEAALELSRQGLSATEVTKRLNDSLILARLSGLSASEAVAGLTAAVNSFTKAGLTTSEVLNKISNAANQFAVSERDLIEGFKRSASVAELAGVSIDELGGIITAVQQKTARGGAVIGNSFKTIFTRIGRKDNLNLLRSLGVDITDIQGKILPATKLIENLAGKLDGLNEIQVRSITQKIGGGFQIAPLLAALSDYSSESSVAVAATEAFRNATDEAYQKNIVLSKTLSAAINSTVLSVKELANALGEIGVTDTFKNILDTVGGFVEKVKGVLTGEGIGSTFARGIVTGLSGVLIKGGLALFALLVGKLTLQLAKFGIESFKTFFGLNKAAKQLENTQRQIAATLLKDSAIRKQILNIENSTATVAVKRAQQAAVFTTALNEQLRIVSQISRISGSIAGPVVRGTQEVRNSAGGFIPVGAENRDISKGVGGAPKSAKSVVLPNFSFGGGKKGTMVANDSEYIVPNYAGGGSAIFNQDMANNIGLPKGAKKINAAGGYIPNFASVAGSKFGPAGVISKIGAKDINDVKNSPFTQVVGKKVIYDDGDDKWEGFESNFYSGKDKKFRSGADATKALEDRAGKQASGKGIFDLDANQLGGIALISPRFGSGVGSLKTPEVNLGGIKAINARFGEGNKDIKDSYVELSNIQTANTPSGKDVKGLTKDVNKFFAQGIVDLAQSLYSPFNVASGGEFADKLQNLGTTQKLLPPAAEGALFEAAGKVALSTSKNLTSFFKKSDENRPFDFNDGKALNKFFKVNASKGEAKRGEEVGFKSGDQVKGLLKKTFNDSLTGPKAFALLEAQGLFSAARGYIPNFADERQKTVTRQKASKKEREAGITQVIRTGGFDLRSEEYKGVADTGRGEDRSQIDYLNPKSFTARIKEMKGRSGKSFTKEALEIVESEDKQRIKNALGAAGPKTNLDQWIKNKKAKKQKVPSLVDKNEKVSFLEQKQGLINNIKGELFERWILENNEGLIAANTPNAPLDFQYKDDVKNAKKNILIGAEAKVGEFTNHGLISKAINQKFGYDNKNEKSNNISQLGVLDVLVPSSARGYIPNYAQSPLENAVQREREAGLNTNQIRINQSGKLRNAGNPQGLAVTNTRDEPTGRIPNFAITKDTLSDSGISSSSVKAFASSLDSLNKKIAELNQEVQNGTKSYEEASKEASEYAKTLAEGNKKISGAAKEGISNVASGSIEKKEDKARGDSTAKLIGLSAIAFSLQGAFSSIEGELSGFQKGLAGAAESAAGAVTTFALFESFGQDLTDKNAGLLGLINGKGEGKGGPGILKTLGGKGGKTGKIASGFGKTIGFATKTFTKLLPFIGQAVVAFQGLSAISKLVGGAFGEQYDVIKQVTDFFSGLITGVAENLNLIDTPAEKAAKALSELGEAAIQSGLDLSKGPLNLAEGRLGSRRAALAGAKGEDGKLLTDPAAIVAGILKTRGESGGGVLGKISTGRDDQTLAQEISKQFERGLLNTLGTEDRKVIIDNPEKIGEVLDKQFNKLSKDQQKEAKRGVGSITGLESKLARAVTDEDVEEQERLQKLIIKEEESQANILKILIEKSKERKKEEEIQKKVVKLDSERFRLLLDSNLERAKTLASIKTEAQFQLELEASSGRAGKIRTEEIQKQIRGLESQKKLNQDISNAFVKRIQGNQSIQNALAPDATDKIKQQTANEIKDILVDTNILLLSGKKIEGDIANIVEDRLSKISGIEKLSGDIVSVIRTEITEITKKAKLEQAITEQANARLRLLKLETEEISEQRRQRDLQRDTSKTLSNTASKSTISALEIDKLRAELSLGGVYGSRNQAGGKRNIAEIDFKIRAEQNRKQQEDFDTGQKDSLVSRVRGAGFGVDRERNLEKIISDTAPKDIPALVGKIETAIVLQRRGQEAQAKQDIKDAQSIIQGQRQNVADFSTASISATTAMKTNVDLFGSWVSQLVNKEAINVASGKIETETKSIADRGGEIKELKEAILGLESKQTNYQNSLENSFFKKANIRNKVNNQSIERNRTERSEIENAGLDQFKFNLGKYGTRKEQLEKAEKLGFDSVADAVKKYRLLGEKIKELGAVIKEDSQFIDRTAKKGTAIKEDLAQKQQSLKEKEAAQAQSQKTLATSKLDVERLKSGKLETEDKSGKEAAEKTTTAVEKTTDAIKLLPKQIADFLNGALKSSLSSELLSFGSGLPKLSSFDSSFFNDAGAVDLASPATFDSNFNLGSSFPPSSPASGIQFEPTVAAVDPDVRNDVENAKAKADEQTKEYQNNSTKSDLDRLKALQNINLSITTASSLAAQAAAAQADTLQNALFKARTSFATGDIENALVSGTAAGAGINVGLQGGSDEERVLTENRILATLQLQADIASEIDASKRVALEDQLDKTIRIAELNTQVAALIDAKDFEGAKALLTTISAIKKESIGIKDQLYAAFVVTPEQGRENFKTAFVDASVQFRDNVINGMTEAIAKGGDLKDILLDASVSFLQSLYKANLQNIAGSLSGIVSTAFSGFGGGATRQAGGRIYGGSGTKDDVPAMLMGGEYVVKKSAVSKYGQGFMDSINQGSLPAYAEGGLVTENKKELQELPTQTGEGGFFTPGLQGYGDITGRQNLLDFATQGSTSGATDIISNLGGTGAYIDLEPESRRLTNFGRNVGTPEQTRVQEAKKQALGLVFQYDKTRDEQLDLWKQKKDARNEALKNAIISSVASAAISSFSSGYQNASDASKETGGNFFQNIGAGLKGGFTGGTISSANGTQFQGQNFGGLLNIFNSKGYVTASSFPKFAAKANAISSQLSTNTANQVTSSVAEQNKISTPNKGNLFQRVIGGVGNGFKELFQTFSESTYNPATDGFFNGDRVSRLVNGSPRVGEQAATEFNKNVIWDGTQWLDQSTMSTGYLKQVRGFASGGMIPPQAGMDTVPAMLNGGEFVMNSAAVSRVGESNLQGLNAGGNNLESNTDTSSREVIDKLEDLIDVSKDKVGDINITINTGAGAGAGAGNGGQGATTGRQGEGAAAGGLGGNQTNEDNKRIANLIKEQVLAVLADEKRLGGQLRR